METELENFLFQNLTSSNSSFYEFANMYPNPIKSPVYMTTLDFEQNFQYHEWRVWMGRNYMLSVYISIIYVTGIFLGQKWMKEQRPYKLGTGLKVWNFLLAVFSLVGFLRSVPEVLYLLNKADRFYQVSCSRDELNVATTYWSFFGTLSKVVELGDTAFLVLRKRPVIFLHWYHHTSVMLYTWFTFVDLDPCHRWFTVMNYFVHTVMYSYFALRAMGFKLSKNISIVITSLQIVQMIVGLLLNIHGLYVLHYEIPCSRKLENIQMCLIMYLSYMILFSHFFYKSYCSPISKAKKQTYID